MSFINGLLMVSCVWGVGLVGAASDPKNDIGVNVNCVQEPCTCKPGGPTGTARCEVGHTCGVFKGKAVCVRVILPGQTCSESSVCLCGEVAGTITPTSAVCPSQSVCERKELELTWSGVSKFTFLCADTKSCVCRLGYIKGPHESYVIKAGDWCLYLVPKSDRVSVPVLGDSQICMVADCLCSVAEASEKGITIPGRYARLGNGQLCYPDAE